MAFTENSYNYANMALNADNVKKLYDTIHFDLIEQSTDLIENRLKNFFETIMDNIWSGPSADEFKDYVWDEFDKLKDNLEDLSAEMEDAIINAANKSTEADAAAGNYFSGLGRD